jgi:hypothetical protein
MSSLSAAGPITTAWNNHRDTFFPMEIQGPLTVEELQEANILAAPKLLRGSVRRQSQQNLNPSQWRLILVGLIGLFFLMSVLFNPAIDSAEKWGLLLLLTVVFGYRLFFRSKAVRKVYARRIDRIPRVLSVDSDGVRLEDRAKMFQFRPWSAYKTWREGSQIFILRGPQRLSNVVPKRGLTSQQIDELRVMLATHMPDCA